MMEFKDTGLPSDPVIYDAFTVYLQKHNSLSREDQEKDKSLSIAQLLHETVGNDQALISYALLSTLTPAAWSFAERRFGAETAALQEEIDMHNNKRLKEVASASKRAKCFFMAADIINVMDRMKEIKNFGKVLEDGQIVDSLDMPQPPRPDVFERLFDDVRGTTDASLLEHRYQGMLNLLREPYKENYPEENTGAREVPIDFGLEHADENRAVEFPLFEETRLPDHHLVRGAFEALSEMADLMHFQEALEAAEILSNLGVQNHTAIAATLLNGIVNLTAPSVDNLEKELGKDVIDVLFRIDPNNPVAWQMEIKGNQRLMDVAFSIVAMKYMQKDTETMLRFMRDESPVFSQDQKEVLERASDFIQKMQKLSLVPPSTPVSPELESMFAQQLRELTAYVADATPKPPSSRTTPPKPKF